jgi:hypothetical protein
VPDQVELGPALDIPYGAAKAPPAALQGPFGNGSLLTIGGEPLRAYAALLFSLA